MNKKALLALPLYSSAILMSMCVRHSIGCEGGKVIVGQVWYNNTSVEIIEVGRKGWYHSLIGESF